MDFEELFRNNFFHSAIRSGVFDSQEKTLGAKFLKHRCNYMLDVCGYIALVDKIDPSVVYSYVMFREECNKLVLYFAYTKKAFRQKGLITYLINLLNPLGKQIKISYTGRMPVYVLSKNFNFERGAV